VATATAAGGHADDLTIEAAGSIKPATAGAAVTLNSPNIVKNAAAIGFNNLDGSTGVLVLNGGGGVINAGAISLVEDYTPEDTDKFAGGSAFTLDPEAVACGGAVVRFGIKGEAHRCSTASTPARSSTMATASTTSAASFGSCSRRNPLNPEQGGSAGRRKFGITTCLAPDFGLDRRPVNHPLINGTCCSPAARCADLYGRSSYWEAFAHD
jgi:hypothetical protein